MKINCMTILSPFGMNTDVYETILKFPTILRRLCLSKINDADQDDADQDDTNRDVADQGTITNNRKVVNNRAEQEEAMNTDTSNQETTSDNKSMKKSTKTETDNVKNDADHCVQVNFIVRMNGINSQDLFATDDKGDHKVDICDNDAIDIIYTNVVKHNVAKLLVQYPQYERQYIWNRFDLYLLWSSAFTRGLSSSSGW